MLDDLRTQRAEIEEKTEKLLNAQQLFQQVEYIVVVVDHNLQLYCNVDVFVLL